MKRFSISLIMAALTGVISPLPSVAAIISPEQALNRLKVSKKLPGKLKNADIQLYKTVRSNGDAAVYIMGVENQPTLVLNASDNGPALLGYTDAAFSSDIPEAMNEWLNQIAAQISYCERNGVRMYEPASESFVDMDPLLKTIWNQNGPYNNKTPEQWGYHTPTGCVATALGQIFKYWEYPKNPTGEVSYLWGNIEANQNETLSYDFNDVEFDYSKILNTYAVGNPTEEEKEEVAKFMLALGMGFHMAYQSSSSSANTANAAVGTVSYFKYSKALSIESRDTYFFKEWIELLCHELLEKRPIFMTGANAEAAHAFVVDGMNADGYYHVNWGWGGTSNGYYLITGMEPPDQGIGGSNAGYNINQVIFANLHPPVEGENNDILPTSLINCDFGPEAKSYARTGVQSMNFINSSSNLSTGWASTAFESIYATRGIKFTNQNGDVYYHWATKSTTPWDTGKYYTSFAVIANPNYSGLNIPNGTYTATPVVKNEETGIIHPAQVKITCRKSVDVTVTDDYVTVTHPKTLFIDLVTGLPQLNSPLYPGLPGKMTISIDNYGDEYYGNITLYLKKSYWDSKSYTLGKIFMDIPENQSADLIWTGNVPADLESGDYMLFLDDYRGGSFGSMPTVKISSVPTEATQVEISNVEFSNKSGGNGLDYDPYLFKGTSMNLKFNLKCTQGYYTNPIFIKVYEASSNTLVKMIQLPQQYIAAGQNVAISSNVVLTDPKIDRLYRLELIQRKTSAQGYTSDVALVNNAYYMCKFTDLNTSVGNTNSDKTGVLIEGGKLKIFNFEPIEHVELIDFSGRVVSKTKGNGDSTLSVSIPVGGAWIARIKGLTATKNIKITR